MIIKSLYLFIFSFVTLLNSSELLTQKEKEYLQKNNTFTVCNQYNVYPLTGIKDKKLVGISGEVFEQFAQKLNIKFIAIDVESDENLNQKVASNKCDFVSIIGTKQKRFLNIRSSQVLYKDYLTSIGNLKSSYIDNETDFSEHKFFVRYKVHEQRVKKAYPNLNIQRIYNLDIIMEKLRQNSKYHLISPRLMNETYVQRYGFDKYKQNGIFENIDNETSVGINKNIPIMINIINKVINSLGEEYFKQIKNKYILKEFKIEKSYNIFILTIALFLAFLLLYVYYRKKEIEKTNNLISQQKLELTKLTKEQEVLLKLFDKGDFVLFKWKNDEKWSIEYVSSNVSNLLTYSKDDILNSKITYSMCIHKDDIHNVEEEVKQLSQSCDEYFKHKPYRIITKDKKVKWVSDVTVIIKDENGQISHYLGYIEDITEQITTQKKLQESEFRWKFAIEGSGDGLWDWNIKTNKVYFSPQWKAMLGFKENEISSSLEEWSKRVHPSQITKVYEDIQNYIDGKSDKYISEHQVLCKDGSYKWVLDRGIIVEKDEKGNASRIIGTHTNIDVSKKLQTQLLQAQKTASLGIWEFDIKSEGLVWSDEIYKIFEIDKNKLKASYEVFVEAIHPDDRQKVYEAYQNSLITKEAYNINHRLLMPDGRIKYVREQCKTSFDTQGNPLVSLGTVQDITEEQELQNQVLYEKNFISTIIDNANAIIAVIDSSGTMIRLNSYGEKFTGYTQEEISKEPYLWKKFLAQEVQEKVINIIENAKKGKIVKSFQNSWISKDGIVKVFEWSNMLVTKEDGTMDYLSTIGIDITQKKEEEEALKKAKESADKANKAKSLFLANMSHEIRTPLNGMIGLTKLLFDTNLDETQKKYLNKSLNSSEILLNLLNDVLDYSKIEANKVELFESEFTLDSMIQNLSDMFSYQAYEKGLDYIFTVDSNIPQVLIADQSRLMQVLINLIGNSIKFTSSGHITINLSLKNKTHNSISILFSIQDTGIGISQEKQEKLFQAFEQGDNTTTKKFGGTGLGLMISKKLVELMGGDICLKSEANIGSTFSFELTLAYDSKSLKNNYNKTLFQNQKFILLKPKKALLVEDNETNQLVASKLFEQIGFEVSIANNGKIALEKAKNNKYDIIFMDIHMPIMDGFESALNIRKFDKVTPIIALSAAVMKEDKEQSMKAKMNGHLSKPINYSELEESLKNYFELENIIKENVIENIDISIDGIDIKKLQNELNLDEKGVCKHYNKFKNNYKKELTSFMENIDSKEFLKPFIHKLKGVSGNLRINSLYTLCIDIEENDYSKDLLNKLSFELQNILQEIQNKISPLMKNNSKELTKEDFKKLLSLIIQKLDSYEFIEDELIEQLIKGLENTSFIKDIDEINKLFDLNETEQLVEVLKNIQKIENESM